jgi:hypothetical protein
MTSAKSSQHRPSITVHLSYPVSHDGKAISELTLRRPTVADQLASVEGGGGVAGIELRAGSGNLNIWYKCIFCLRAA